VGGGVRAARSGAPERSRGPFEKKYRNVVRNRRETPTFAFRARLFAREVSAEGRANKKPGFSRRRRNPVAPVERLFASFAFFAPATCLLSSRAPARRRTTLHALELPPTRYASTSSERARALEDARIPRPSRALRREGVRQIANQRSPAFSPPTLAAPSTLRWRPPPWTKTSPPRWSCRTWYARDGSPRFRGLAGAIPTRVEPRRASTPRDPRVDSTHSGQVSANWRDS
jgi:hypothetical protein